MEIYTEKNQKKMRIGYTTGSCAVAASKAAAVMLLDNEPLSSIKIKTPSGLDFFIDIVDFTITANYVICSVIKDSGDDPDVTNGIKIIAKVSKTKALINIDGGEGIGRVTKKGLSVEVGKAAINPAPMAQIKTALEEVSIKYGYDGGFDVIISAENGEEISKKTFNQNLGIIGGISILGTSGIVEPMSEKALIDTIKLEIDFRYEYNNEIIFLCLGNYGRDFALEKYNLDLNIGVKCSNFIGEALDYCVFKGFKKILIIGHGGKLIKLAGGIMNTHSKTADCRNEIFAAHSALYGIKSDVIQNIMRAITVDECLDILEEFKDTKEKIILSIGDKIKSHINKRVNDAIEIEFIIFTLDKGEIIKTDNVYKFINYVNKIGGYYE